MFHIWFQIVCSLLVYHQTLLIVRLHILFDFLVGSCGQLRDLSLGNFFLSFIVYSHPQNILRTLKDNITEQSNYKSKHKNKKKSKGQK